MTFNILELRKSKGISQHALAEKSGVSRATIWKLETEKDYVTSTSTLEKIAAALEVSVDALFSKQEV